MKRWFGGTQRQRYPRNKNMMMIANDGWGLYDVLSNKAFWEKRCIHYDPGMRCLRTESDR